MKRKKISLDDIANKIGVSQMTVSRALHGRHGVSEELQKQIIEVAHDMGYVPSRAIANLEQAGQTLTVGIVLPHIAHTIFPEVIENIEGYLSTKGYRIILCCSYNNPIKEFREISSLLERKIDGIIWCPTLSDDNKQLVGMIKKMKCPLVFLDRKLDNVKADSAIIDDYDAMARVAKHLLEQGVTKFAYLNSRMHSSVARDRFNGFYDTIKAANIDILPENNLKIGSDLQAGRKGAKLLLNNNDRVEAIVCFNDPIALGVQLELRNNDIKIPEEIAITGFSGVIETELAAIPITTVHQDAAELGLTAARLLYCRMQNPHENFIPINDVQTTSLKIRKSSMIKS